MLGCQNQKSYYCTGGLEINKLVVVPSISGTPCSLGGEVR